MRWLMEFYNERGVVHENTVTPVAAAKPLGGVLKFCPTRFAPGHRLSS
jgi:hypothetical protein